MEPGTLRGGGLRAENESVRRLTCHENDHRPCYSGHGPGWHAGCDPWKALRSIDIEELYLGSARCFLFPAGSAVCSFEVIDRGNARVSNVRPFLDGCLSAFRPRLGHQ